MNTKITIESLVDWINLLIESAKKDDDMLISWFEETKDEKLSIIGGWMDGFSKDYNDILCISKSNPKYAMCVKIAVNEGPYAYTDFELMNMPVNSDGDVDDTCIALDYDEDVYGLAQFLSTEWERMMKEYVKEEE